MAAEILDTCRRIIEVSGGVCLESRGGVRPQFNGEDVVGLARMGNDPRTSVVNRWNRTHDVKNLWILDGASFTSGTEKSPTLTVIALAMRAAQNIAEALRRGEV